MHAQEYGAQIMLATMHAVVIIGGSLATAALLNAAGYPSSRPAWSSLAVLVRDWGFALLIVPAIWVIVTVKLENSLVDPWTKRATIVSGIALLLSLSLPLALAAMSSVGGTLISATKGDTQEQRGNE